MKLEKEKPVIEESAIIQKLATEFDIPVENFLKVFDKEEDMLTVINHVGKYDKNKIQNIVLLTLFGYKIFFEQDEVTTHEIRRNISVNRISLNNYGTHTNDLTPKYIRRVRDLGSSFRLTRLGFLKASDLVKEITNTSTTIGVHNDTNDSIIETLIENDGLWSACKVSFENEQYWDACFNACRHLETKIREKSELSADSSGTDLVNKSFNPDGGILKIPCCALPSEEEGFHLINRGVILFHRNAKGHREGILERKDATKIICYVDYLLEILKTAEKRNQPLTT